MTHPKQRAKGRAQKRILKIMDDCRNYRGPACSENGILGYSNREIEQRIGIAAPNGRARK